MGARPVIRLHIVVGVVAHLSPVTCHSSKHSTPSIHTTTQSQFSILMGRMDTSSSYYFAGSGTAAPRWSSLVTRHSSQQDSRRPPASTTTYHHVDERRRCCFCCLLVLAGLVLRADYSQCAIGTSSLLASADLSCSILLDRRKHQGVNNRTVAPALHEEQARQ